MRFLSFAIAFLAVCCQAANVTTVSIPTSLMPGEPMQAVVITPDGPAGAKYPVVYLLNGYDGNHLQWSQNTAPALPELADKYGMVMVMPDGRDTWYWDSPAQPEIKMESFIINELVPYVDSHFPTIPDASKRAITGLSMGGQGAMWLAFRHPDVFKSVGSTSGGLDIRKFPKNWKIGTLLGSFEENEPVWEEHAIVNLVPALEPGQLNIIFDCGVDDFFAPVNDAMHQALVDAKIPHDYISRPGKHTHAYWRNAILYQLLYFNQIFNQ